MLKPLILALVLLATAGAVPAHAQSQPWSSGDGGGFVQPFAGSAPAPGISDPAPLGPDSGHSQSLVPTAPIGLRQITAARPLVVELFTSEGCSSCPPADQYLTELAQRRDLLPLSFHVDYWDYIGWQDRFAAPAFSQRQRDYAKAKGERMVYTPQMVIAGAVPAVGSDRVAVEAGLREARNRKAMAEPVLIRDGAGLRLTLPATSLAVPATLWFVTYSHRDVSDVAAGENSGRRMVSANVVRSLRRIGEWSGGAFTQALRLTESEIAALPDACAVIANEAGFGPVVAAAAWNFNDLR